MRIWIRIGTGIGTLRGMEIRIRIRDGASDGYLDFDNMYWDSKKSFLILIEVGFNWLANMKPVLSGKLGLVEVWECILKVIIGLIIG